MKTYIITLALVLVAATAHAQRPTHYPGAVLTGAGTLTPRSGYFVSLTQVEQGIAWRRFEIISRAQFSTDMDLNRDTTLGAGIRYTYSRGTRMVRGNLLYISEVDRRHSPYDVGPRGLTGSVEAWIGWGRTPRRPHNGQ